MKAIINFFLAVSCSLFFHGCVNQISSPIATELLIENDSGTLITVSSLHSLKQINIENDKEGVLPHTSGIIEIKSRGTSQKHSYQVDIPDYLNKTNSSTDFWGNTKLTLRVVIDKNYKLLIVKDGKEVNCILSSFQNKK